MVKSELVSPSRRSAVAGWFAECAHEMKTMPYVYWQHKGMWIAYLQEFPDYWTHGKSKEELERNLRELWQDVTGGAVPEVRRIAYLRVS